MTDYAAVDDAQDRTDNPEHAFVDTICERLLDRATDSRTDLPGVYLGATMATVVDRYRDSVIQRLPVDGVSFRTAAADHDIVALDGVRIGTVATQVLNELNAEPQP